jgi:hypothetical protein
MMMKRNNVDKLKEKLKWIWLLKKYILIHFIFHIYKYFFDWIIIYHYIREKDDDNIEKKQWQQIVNLNLGIREKQIRDREIMARKLAGWDDDVEAGRGQ